MMSACSKSDSCVLVRLDGSKELIALAEGLRESSESWTDAPRDVPAPRRIPAVTRPITPGRARNSDYMNWPGSRYPESPTGKSL